MSEKQKRSIWFGVLIVLLGCCLLPLVHKLLNPHITLSKSEINVIFRESIMQVTPTQGDILEVATLESNETLTRRDSKTLFENIYLGTTVSEIKVLVTYRYHIRLSDEWDLNQRGTNLEIRAPQVRPSLPPAIHTDQMEKRSEAGWLRFNAQENMQELEASLTSTLEATSVTPAKVTLVKDSARKAIEKFVRTWVITQPRWKDTPIDQVLVYFPDEKPPYAQP